MQKEDLLFILVPAAAALILVLVIRWFFTGRYEKTKELHYRILRSITQLAVILFALYLVGDHFDVFNGISRSVLFSSSLLVVVLGFAFQTSLEDFIAGVLISIFKPFKKDDRITLVEKNISGYVEDITLRHTVVRTFNNSRLIVPNSVMNKAIIDNTRYRDNTAVGFMDVMISYETDIDAAVTLLRKIIEQHKTTIDVRTPEQIRDGQPSVGVFVRELADNGISLRAMVITRDIDDNFAACSDIRAEIVRQFAAHNLEIAYPHVQLIYHQR